MELALRDQQIRHLRNVQKGLTNDLNRMKPNNEMSDKLTHGVNNILDYLHSQHGGSSDSTHLNDKIEFAINDISRTLGEKF